jgi:hypothetical protein
MKIIFILFFIFSSISVIGQCDSTHKLNTQIVNLVGLKINKKVGTGECWDLAKYALDEVGAKWDGGLVYGRKLTASECIYPGDIIQFEKIKIKYKKGKEIFTEAMPHHTAIIYKVIDKNEVTLIHQNTGYTGRKVGTSSLKFSTILSGKYYIYRPEN